MTSPKNIFSFLTGAFLLLLNGFALQAQDWTITSLADLPEAVSNNAVVSAEVNGNTYVYSFAGIDSTKSFSGIHNRCWRYDVAADSWSALPDLPDAMGKIATGASVVNGVAYVFGGYHVFPDGSEITIDKVHRLDLATNTWMTDGQVTPVPVDDHVQAVWRDSLIYLVTGWSGDQNSGTNVTDVQIYNPALDSWSVATATPNHVDYKVFGASGAMLGDTIYYFGGARISATSFLPSTILRTGIINPSNPTEISWSEMSVGNKGYRPACTVVMDQLYWLGGSDVTYNYNGIAYNGSGGVSPNQSSQVYDPMLNVFKRVEGFSEIPMDLRGIAEISPTERIIVGGMEANQKVSKKTWLLKWEASDILPVTNLPLINFRAYPNPIDKEEKLSITIEKNNEVVNAQVFDIYGRLVHAEKLSTAGENELGWRAERSGVYFLVIAGVTKKIVVY